MLVPAGSTGVLEDRSSEFGEPVPLRQMAVIERMLQAQARQDAMQLAATYARSDVSGLATGVSEFGRQLMTELGVARAKFDFQGVVSRNPAFWLAERELAPTDVSLPYLVSMLAILSHDYTTASRMLALAQASLPLTPTVRRAYARPEAMLLTLDQLVLRGIPLPERMEDAGQCEHAMDLVRQRIVQWSARPVLVRMLVELEVRRIGFTSGKKKASALDQRLSERLGLTASDTTFIHHNDPILATAFDATVREWLAGQTLAQRWRRWVDLSDPAEANEAAASVAAFEQNTRPELAWLTWRSELVLCGIVNERESQHWQKWCDQLMDPTTAAEVRRRTLTNPLVGRRSMPVIPEGYGEGWSGDSRIHPLLAIRTERQIALIDVVLSVVRPGSRDEASFHLNRASTLANIGAIEPSRDELRRARAIVGVVDAIKITEAQLLAAERHFPEAEALHRQLLEKPALAALRRNQGNVFFMAGDYAAANKLLGTMAREHPDDTYRAIMAEITARRQGRTETAILRAARGAVDPGKWPAAGIRYLFHELTEDELLATARHGTLYEIASNECEATFWLGEVALAEGRIQDGIMWLSRCLGTGFVTNVEFKIADAELERLLPKEPRPKESEHHQSAYPLPT